MHHIDQSLKICILASPSLDHLDGELQSTKMPLSRHPPHSDIQKIKSQMDYSPLILESNFANIITMIYLNKVF